MKLLTLERRNLKVLITGSSGFIGRNLAEQLNHDLLTPSHAELELEDKQAVNKYFEKNKIDVVVNCASRGDRSGTIKHDLKIWTNIADNKVNKIIHLGSGAEYDKTRPIVRIKEDDFGKRIPDDDYGYTKYLISKFIEEGSYNAVCLRLFGVFGKYEDPERRFISRSIRRVLNYDPILIYKDVWFDYLYIDDLVRIVDWFIKNEPLYKFYNVGTGKPIGLTELAEKIRYTNYNVHIPIKVLQKGMANEYSCDNSRLMAELGDFEFTPMDKAIKELYEWLRKESKKHKK